MKKIKTNVKLSLNKESISELNSNIQANILGGFVDVTGESRGVSLCGASMRDCSRDNKSCNSGDCIKD